MKSTKSPERLQKRNGNLRKTGRAGFQVVFCVCICISGIGQNSEGNNTSFFKKSAFCQPFVSEFESYLPKLEVHLASNSQEYDLSGSGKPMKVFQSTSLGIELPWYNKIVVANDLPNFGFAFSTQISAHLWWDPLEYSTSPILNTDYRFGPAHFKFIKYYHSGLLRNFSIKLAPFNHESTHLGDELMLYRERMKYPIKRVNVSYEYSELQFTFNDPGDYRAIKNSFRTGMAIRVNGSQDYYTMSGGEGDTTLAIATGLKCEYYLQYNLKRKSGSLTSKKWSNVFSVEVRNRPVYKYPCFDQHDNKMSETCSTLKRCYSVNALYGWKYENQVQRPTIGIYLHCYMGQNPYGQFRNRVDFKSVGLTLVVE